jgi:hypothetical protein
MHMRVCYSFRTLCSLTTIDMLFLRHHRGTIAKLGLAVAEETNKLLMDEPRQSLEAAEQAVERIDQELTQSLEAAEEEKNRTAGEHEISLQEDEQFIDGLQLSLAAAKEGNEQLIEEYEWNSKACNLRTRKRWTTARRQEGSHQQRLRN